MIEAKIKKMQVRNEELTEILSNPEILSDQKRYKVLAREQNEINTVLSQYNKLHKVVQQIDDDQNIIDMDEDADLVAIAREEIEGLEEKREVLKRS